VYPLPEHNLLIGLKKIIDQQENLQIGIGGPYSIEILQNLLFGKIQKEVIG